MSCPPRPLPAPSLMSGSTDPSLTQLPTKMSLIDLAPSPPEVWSYGSQKAHNNTSNNKQLKNKTLYPNILPVILLDMVGWGLAFCPMETSTNAWPPSMWTCGRFWGPHNILPWVSALSFQQACRDNWQWTFGTMDCKTVETTLISLRRTMECFYSVGKRIYSKANCIIVKGSWSMWRDTLT